MTTYYLTLWTAVILQEYLTYVITMFGNVIVNYLSYINLTCFGIAFVFWKICKKYAKHLGTYHCVCMPVRILVYKDQYWLDKSLFPATQHYTLPQSNVRNQWFFDFSNIIIFSFIIIVKSKYEQEFEENLSISEGNFELKREKSE